MSVKITILSILQAHKMFLTFLTDPEYLQSGDWHTGMQHNIYVAQFLVIVYPTFGTTVHPIAN